MGAKWQDAVIGQGDRGSPTARFSGRALVCEECDGRRWYLFLVQTHQTAHAQCAQCGQAVCLDPDECESCGPAAPK